MSDKATQMKTQFVSDTGLKEIDTWIAKYPKSERQSAVMRGLMVIQEEHGYLTSELMTDLANYLEMPPIAVFEVASFYSMYESKPIGRNLINVCTNISCKLRGSAEIVNHLEKKLNITLGETTKDNKFTLRQIECLGACVNAPMMQINKDYHENLENKKIDEILENYK
ncbi:MAG: NADH dehydrogenase [Legionellales bacterium RIFCSPHIGHO2_12_FULL_35_11]|nr:MAG: NADH dehydrogenase [Legionellales bacterium RIFCSPHIGHO2_12_FULL_35_11]